MQDCPAMERAYGLEIPQSLEEVCDPRRLAVVVYDTQVGVLNQIDRSAEVTDRVDDVHPWFLRGSPGFELVPEMAPKESEAVLDKITMSAFEGTPLDIILRDCGLAAFAIVGVATEI